MAYQEQDLWSGVMSDVIDMEQQNHLMWSQPGTSTDPPQHLELTCPPVPTIGPPDRYPITGPSEFTVEISRSTNRKSKFSDTLNCIYTDWNVDFGVKFNWNRMLHPNFMYVRATLVFSKVEDAQQRVETCVQHRDTAKSAIVAKHVLISSRAVTNTDEITYCGDPECRDSWLSVLVKLHKTSDEPCDHAFQFVCRRTCASGMRRRDIGIIFTLENQWGRVFGRQWVGAHVSADPCRDKNSAEKPAPRAKKRRHDSANSQDMLLLPNVPITTTMIMRAGLQVMLILAEHSASQHSDDPEALQKDMISITALKDAIQDLE